jgi:hypothetical protein
MDAIEWNQRWPVGTRVRLTKADGQVLRTLTVSAAQRWGGLDHVAVGGMSGFVMLSWCEPEGAGDTTPSEGDERSPARAGGAGENTHLPRRP